MKIIKMFSSVDHMRHEMVRIQSKDHNIRIYRINKIYLFCYNYKNIYLKMDIIGYHIFANLLGKHTQIILSNLCNLFFQSK